MDLEYVKWIELNPVAGSYEHCTEPSCSLKAKNFLAALVTVNFSEWTVDHEGRCCEK
jgi:hypothetical protein